MRAIRDTPRRRFRRSQLRARGSCPSEIRVLTPNGRFVLFRCLRYGWRHELHRIVVRGPIAQELLPAQTIITWGAPGMGRP